MNNHSMLPFPRLSRRILLALLPGCLLPAWTTTAQFDPDPVWIRRDPVNVNLNGVAYGLNRFIAVGNNGYWFTSPNAQTWTVRTPMTEGHLSAIHFASGRFVAVGDGIYSSTDGVTWTKAGLPYSRLALTDVAAADSGNWMAVGRLVQPNGALGNGITFTSANGVDWVRAALGAPAKIAFGAGSWFGVGNSDGGQGPNMLKWVSFQIDPDPPEYKWMPVFLDDLELPQPNGSIIRFLNGRFVVAGMDTSVSPAEHRIFTSTDGVNWPRHSVANQGVPADGANQPRYSVMRDLPFGGGVYLGIAAGSPSPTADYWFRADAMTSTDGVNWAFIDRTSLSTATASRAMTAITHANGMFVAVGYRGTTPFRINVATTPDGSAWTSRAFNPTVFQRSANETTKSLAVGNGLVVGVTAYGGAAVSDDRGLTWGYADVTTGGLALEAVAFGGNRFVAVGQQGRAYRSTDGYSWSSVVVPDAFYLWNIAYDGSQFVAVGQYRDAGNTVQRGIVSRSTDGASWTTTQLPDTTRLDQVAFGNGAYLALGMTQSPSLPTVQISLNGVDWTPVAGAPALTRIAFGGGRFLGATGVAGNPGFHTSVNGTEWTQIDAAGEMVFPPFFAAVTLSFVNGHFVMGGNEYGILFLENDLWQQRAGPNNAAVTFIEDTYVATSLWTYRLPEPEPPLEAPVLTWLRGPDSVQLEFPTRLDHVYRLWSRSGLEPGSTWNPMYGFVAQEELGSFIFFLDSLENSTQLYRVGVEPPGTEP